MRRILKVLLRKDYPAEDSSGFAERLMCSGKVGFNCTITDVSNKCRLFNQQNITTEFIRFFNRFTDKYNAEKKSADCSAVDKILKKKGGLLKKIMIYIT